MVTVAAQLEIAAPPAKVREVFLDFTKYSEWASETVKNITVVSQKEEGRIQPGDKLKVQLAGMSFSPEVKSNTAEEFSWVGDLPLNLFGGHHKFQFLPSEVTPGHTTYHDGEVFHGILTSIYSGVTGLYASVFGGSKEVQSSAAFDKFDAELKKRVESLYGLGKA